MKKFIVLISICLHASSCKKDIRNNYIGEYEFIIKYSTWNISGETSDTSYNYQGKIDLAQEINKLNLYYREANFLTINVYEDGTLECFNCGYNRFRGEFLSSNEMIFNLRLGGLGSSFTYDVKGFKK